MKKRAVLILILCALLLGACTAPPESNEPEAPPVAVEPTKPPAEALKPTVAPAPAKTPAELMEVAMPFELTSTAFAQGEPIPVQFSCDGDDISPALIWGPPPDGTKTQALIMEDPDAPGGTWDHWILFNIPANTYGLEENLPITGINQIPGFISAGRNSWGRSEYGGPCPPSGTHRYFFKLYALDTTLSLDENADKSQVLTAMDGHVLAETELMGTFSR